VHSDGWLLRCNMSSGEAPVASKLDTQDCLYEWNSRFLNDAAFDYARKRVLRYEGEVTARILYGQGLLQC